MQNSTRNSGRYAELDSLRGLAALTVFFSHFILGNDFTSHTFSLVSASPAHMFWDGGAAVSFFFVLSGFVLSLPYMNRPRELPLLSFYFRRALRIYPAFAVAILLSLVLKEHVFRPGGLATYSWWLRSFWQWDLRGNLPEVLRTFTLLGSFRADLVNAVVWSLVVEMNISFLVPFLVFIINKNGLLFNLLLLPVLIYVSINFYVFFFYAGVLLARYREPIVQYCARMKGWHATVMFIAASLSYSALFTFHLNAYRHGHDYFSAIGACLFIILALRGGLFASFLKLGLCRFLGKISYSFYLIHLPVFITVASLWPVSGWLSVAGVAVTSITCSCIIAYLMYKCVEEPFLRLSHWATGRFSFFNLIKFR